MRVPVLVVSALVGACSASPAKSPESGPRTLVLSVVSTNDVHGQLERLPFVAGHVENLKRARGADGAVLLVDAGDAFQGTLESNANEGKAIVAAFTEMGVAAMALGNHEFDFGPVGERSVPFGPEDDPQGALKARLAEAPFPILAANLRTDVGRLPDWKHLAASAETTIDGVKIGIVGLLTIDAPEVIKRPDFAGLHVTPLAEAAEHEARALRARGADVVLVVAHAGGECHAFADPNDLGSCDPDSEIFRLARALPPGLVNAILGGHRNASVAHVVNGIPVAHATSNLLAFSRVDLTLDRGTKHVVGTRVFPPTAVCTVPVEAGCRPAPYEGAEVVADGRTAAAIAPAIDAARAAKDRPVGAKVAEAFPVDKAHEMALGNLFADLMREAVPGADAAFGNAGSVRDVLPEGDLTYGRLLHVMPFDNQLAKLSLTGKQLRALLVANLTQAEHGLLSLSGVRAAASCQGGALEVTLQHPDGAAIRDDETLTVVTNDFLALGGDGLLSSIGLPEQAVDLDEEHTVFRALVDGIARRGTLVPSDPALFDRTHPRLKFDGELPVKCAGR